MLFPEAECTEMRMIRNSIWYVILLTSQHNLMRQCAGIITEQDMPGIARKRRVIGTFGLLALLSASLPGNAEEEKQHPHKKYAIAAFLGGTRADSSNEFTVGVEAGYNINSNWSVGAVLERADREQHSTLFLLGFGWLIASLTAALSILGARAATAPERPFRYSCRRHLGPGNTGSVCAA